MAASQERDRGDFGTKACRRHANHYVTVGNAGGDASLSIMESRRDDTVVQSKYFPPISEAMAATQERDRGDFGTKACRRHANHYITVGNAGGDACLSIMESRRDDIVVQSKDFPPISEAMAATQERDRGDFGTKACRRHANHYVTVGNAGGDASLSIMESRRDDIVVHSKVFIYLCKMSKVKALYHIVFCTKHRQMTIPSSHLEDVYRFIWKEVTDAKCKLLRIGGIQNHIHMLIDLHPAISLSHLMQNVKGHSSGWMASDKKFALFKGWASGYYGCTIAPEQKDIVVKYIMGQKTHHLGNSFENELLCMYHYAELTYYEKDLL